MRNFHIAVWIMDFCGIATLVITGACTIDPADINPTPVEQQTVAEPLDLVDDLAPVSPEMYNGELGQELARINAMSLEARTTHFEAIKDRLTRQILNFLQSRGKLTSDEALNSIIEFRYGSILSAQAENSTGRWFRGYVKNRWIARVFFGTMDPIVVLVRCLNGLLLDLPWDIDGLQRVGESTPETFTIRKDGRLTNHVSFRKAIDIAERDGLLLRQGAHPISPDEARQSNNKARVIVIVHEGEQYRRF